MARARAVVGGLLLVLIAAPAYAAPPTHSYGLGELLGPVVEPLQPVTESVGTVLAPITEPAGEILDPVVDPVVEVLSPTDPVLDPVEEVVDPITDPLLDPVEEVVDPITDPLLDPVEEVVDPILDPLEEVIDPPLEPNPPPVGGGIPPGSETNSPQPPVGVAGSLVGPIPSSTAHLGSSAVSLLPPPSAGGVLSPMLAQSLLSQILDWLSGLDAGSLLSAPLLGLQVLFRALVSAGRGLLVPAVMLVALAVVMARDRRIQGTKTP